MTKILMMSISCLNIGGVVRVKVVVDSCQTVEDHPQSNQEGKKEHF